MLTLFFVSQLSGAEEIEITGDQAHHAIKVLRMKLDEAVLISDGNGSWVKARVSRIEKNSFLSQVQERGISQSKYPKLTVIQGLPKSDRVKEAIEIMVESGVDTIVAWEAERSIAKWNKDLKSKWEVAALAAAKQSRRFTIPKIIDGRSLSQLLQQQGDKHALIVMHESGEKKLSSVVSQDMSELTEITIVIGPEGGLSESELVQLAGAGGEIVCLGPEVFRSAHAGGAALSAISALIGRW